MSLARKAVSSRSRVTRCVSVAACVGLFVAMGCGAPPAPESDAPEGAALEVSGSFDTATPDRPHLVDALSMPAEPTLSVDSFTSASECAECHPRHYAEWSTAMHAYATVDPVWRALVGVRQADFNGERDKFCVQCHTAIGTRGGEITANFSWDDLSPISLEGVTCEACHKISSIERPFTGGHVLDESGPIRGPIRDPVETFFHESEYSEIFDSSELCASCHDVFEQHGLNLERPYAEWLESPAAREGKNCQSCHMPTYTGQAAVLDGVPERDNLHSHRFIGVDLPLSPTFIEDPAVFEEVRREVKALLASAGEIELSAGDAVSAGALLNVNATVRNLIDAHNLPTGATFNRQVWIALTATDAAGTVLFETGHLDANGDLRTWGSDEPDSDAHLTTFQSGFTDADGNRTPFPWRAVENVSNSIAPLTERSTTFPIPTAGAVGPITIDAKLRFRQAPPFVARALGLGAAVPRIEIHEIGEATLTVAVEAND